MDIAAIDHSDTIDNSGIDVHNTMVPWYRGILQGGAKWQGLQGGCHTRKCIAMYRYHYVDIATVLVSIYSVGSPGMQGTSHGTCLSIQPYRYVYVIDDSPRTPY